MENSQKEKVRLKRRRAQRVRRSLRGTGSKPRLCVTRSNSHLYAQIINDETGLTLAGVGTYSKELRDQGLGRKSRASAKKLGELIAGMAKEKNIEQVVFDRGSSKYHGVVAELADAARAGGLKF